MRGSRITATSLVLPFFIAAACVAMLIAAILAHVATGRPLVLVDWLPFGYDYHAFYWASERLRDGHSPYEGWYATPPVPALLGVPLTYAPFERVRFIVAAAVFASLIAAVVAMRRAISPDARRSAVFVALVVVAAAASYPVHFAVYRGNIDAFALLALCLGALALRRSEAMAGGLFAFAVAIKVYPVLVVVPLISVRRWRVLAFAAATLLALYAIEPALWRDFYRQGLLSRGRAYSLPFNGSLTSTLFYLGVGAGWLTGRSGAATGEAWKAASMGVFVVLLGGMWLGTLRSARRGWTDAELVAAVAMYFPFMVAQPALAYHYELMCLFAVVPVLMWRWDHARPIEKPMLAATAASIALAQFPAAAFANMSGSVYPFGIPGIGLLLTMLGVIALQWCPSDAAVAPDGPLGLA